MSFGLGDRLRARIAVSLRNRARTGEGPKEAVCLVRAVPLYREVKMATQLAEIFVGIDVSKDGLDVAVWGRTKAWWFANDTAGWAGLDSTDRDILGDSTGSNTPRGLHNGEATGIL